MTRRHLFLAMVLGGLALTAVTPAHATDIDVTTFSDVVANDGVCSLREAIIAANTNTKSGDQTGGCPAGSPTDTDTITLLAGTYTLGIPGTNEDYAATGDLDIRSNLTIQGMGTAPDQTVIDGGNMERVVDVKGYSTQFNATISNVTIQGGKTISGVDGSGIRVDAMKKSTNLTLTQCLIRNNSGGSYGGGVFDNSGGVLTVSQGTISTNTAANSGGGIYKSYGSLVLDHTVVSSNTSNQGGGGGLAMLDVTAASILYGSITGNQASNGGGGGGIYSQVSPSISSSLDIRNSSIDSNDTQGGGGGGGIEIKGPSPYVGTAPTITTTILNSTVANNTAYGGNGGGISDIGWKSSLVATNVTVSGNTAVYGGGIAQKSTGGTATLQNSIVSGNQANDWKDCVGNITSLGHNIIGTATTELGPITPATGDQFDIPSAGLGAFVLSTQAGQSYFPLLDTSPAIDAGDTGAAVQTLLAGVDQLGHARGDGTYDIGAIEVMCGDGIVRAGKEECDLGANNSDTGACTTQCKAAICGDGLVQVGVDECDNGAANSDTAQDACRTSCKVYSCGDGVKDSNEGCEPTLTANCTSACALSSCGNGIVEPGETCDDGNQNNGDVCLNTCVPAFCGDSVVQAGVEECDAGAANSDTAQDACRTTCKAHFCGDGVRDSNEGCEPVLTGKCAPGCKLPTCGDGVLEPGEACDDGNASNTDICLATCVLAACGDSFVQVGVEECDSGVGTGNAVCTGQCKNVVAAGTPGGETTEPAPAPAEPSGGPAAPSAPEETAGGKTGGCSLVIPEVL